MNVTVARIGRAHGLKGELSVELRTDLPEERLARGAVLATEPADAGPLTVAGTRVQAGRWYVRFEEITDRTAAEAARGVELVADVDPDEEDEAWFVQDLVGLTAVRPDGERLGEVVDLMSMPAQDLLVVKQAGGHRAMIPFVDEFVADVDLDEGRIVLTPPYGLLAGEEPEATGETRGED
ncbi:ribosome maturation factor RimM [Demequina sp. NBRC 110052]|uniref:ribosome maturation factor RimM n=1 Tax=Demequina sp. NBRC 110052 TaxID=1570341 RepID=UPI000A04210B|nr:ribosome maturation factor RimM [Demequina sp. NBRC 110052]